jgi:hypothetical protein
MPRYEKGSLYISPVRGAKRGKALTLIQQMQQSGTTPMKPIELKNSDIVFFNEFLKLLTRKEYTSLNVQRFFKQISSRINKKKNCHNCGKAFELAKIFKRCFCNFCMEYVCSKECLSNEKFVIPRSFNLEYDLK